MKEGMIMDKLINKRGKMLKINNRGELLWGQVIFIVLNILFFVVLVIFLVRVGSGALEKEQIYAKKIALLIDSAKPETLIVLNVGDAVEIGKKKNINESVMFVVDNEKSLVKVKLTSYQPYVYNYFSDADVTLELKGESLSINIKAREK